MTSYSPALIGSKHPTCRRQRRKSGWEGPQAAHACCAGDVPLDAFNLSSSPMLGTVPSYYAVGLYAITLDGVKLAVPASVSPAWLGAAAPAGDAAALGCRSHLHSTGTCRTAAWWTEVY